MKPTGQPNPPDSAELVRRLTEELSEIRRGMEILRTRKEGNGRLFGPIMQFLVGLAVAGVIAAHAFLWRQNERTVTLEQSAIQCQQMNADHESRIRTLERDRIGG